MYRNSSDSKSWLIVSAVIGFLLIGSSPVGTSGASAAPASAGEEQLLHHECVFEATHVPRDLVVPWLLPPAEGHPAGLLVADPDLRRTLERAGADLRLLGRYVETNTYYFVRVPSSLAGQNSLSQLGEVLWSRGDTHLLDATGELNGIARTQGMRAMALHPVERSLAALTLKTSSAFVVPLSYSETEDSSITGMLEQVSEDAILTHLRRLTGDTEVVLSDGPTQINTRYSFHPDCLKAAEYIYSQFESMGLEVAYDYYPGIVLFALDFVGLDGFAGGQEGAIYHTADGGSTWEKQESGVSVQFVDASFMDADTGWMCGGGGTVVRTLNGGATWELMGKIRDVYLQGIDFVTPQVGWVCGRSGVIRSTTDGGLSWAVQPSRTSEWINDIDFIDTQCGWAVGDAGTILRTTNGGKKWEEQTSNTEESLRSVFILDLMHGWAVGVSGVVLHTADGGVNWAAQSSGVEAILHSVAFVDSVHGWAAGSLGTVIATTDGGATWDVQQIAAAPYGIRCLRFTDALHGVGASSGGLVRTEDGGESWTYHPDDLFQMRNVVATLPGVSDPAEEYIVCAHYDSASDEPMVDAPGADDNGTGTALVLEAARVLKDRRFGSSIKFVCFSGEEQYLWGSRFYVEDAKLENANIAGVLNMDMVGYGTPSIILYTDPASEWLADGCVVTGNHFLPWLGLEKIVDATWLWGDHVPFWDAGYSAITGIELDHEDTEFYHTTSDTVGTLTLSFTTDVTRLAVASLASLAGLDTTVVAPPTAPVVEDFALGAGYPNPLNPSTRISFSLPATSQASKYSLAIVDPAGRLVRILESGFTSSTPLQRQVTWDGRNSAGQQTASGIYFSYLTCGDLKRARKLVVVR